MQVWGATVELMQNLNRQGAEKQVNIWHDVKNFTDDIQTSLLKNVRT